MARYNKSSAEACPNRLFGDMASLLLRNTCPCQACKASDTFFLAVCSPFSSQFECSGSLAVIARSTNEL